MRPTLLTPNKIFPLAAILAMAIFFARHPEYIGQNCALYLSCARLLLMGQRPYVDFIDLNPPLCTYLACIPTVVSDLLHQPVVAVFHAMILALVALSLLLCAKIANHLQRATGDDGFLLLPTALALSNLPLTFWFGERDQLIALALAPFFLLRMLLYRRDPECEQTQAAQIIIGIWTGLAIALKPQCGLIPLLCEIYFVLSSRPRRPRLSLDIWAMISVLAIYGLHFLILPPDVKDAYFNWLMPMLTHYYNAFNVPYEKAAQLYTYLGPILRSPLTVLALFGLALTGRNKSPLLAPLCVFAAAGWLVYLVQAKGWGYQTIHVHTACWLIAAALIPSFVRPLLARLKKPPSPRYMLLAEALFLFCMYPIISVNSASTGKDLTDCDQSIKRYTKPGESVLIVSSAVAPAYPSLLLNDRKNASRYLWTAPIVMLEYGCADTRFKKEAEEIENQERAVFERLEQDIHEHRPRLVMIECFPTVGPNMFELLLRRGIVQADLSSYKRLGLCNRFVGFLYEGPDDHFEGTYADLAKKYLSDPMKTEEDRFELFRRGLSSIAAADLKAAGKAPGNAYLRRGLAYASLKMYKQAEADLEKAATQPEVNAYVALGFCYLHDQNYKDARRAFARALALKRCRQAFAGLARVYAAQGEYKQALTEANSALTETNQLDALTQVPAPPSIASPSDSQAIALAHAVRAAAYRDMGDMDAATRETALCLQNDPYCVEGYIEKAWQLGSQSQFHDMLLIADKAVSADYTSTDAHKCRAAALQGLHNPCVELEQLKALCLRGKE